MDDAAIGDAGVDVGGGLDLIVEDDGQRTADVVAGDLLETAGAVRRELKADGRVLPLVGRAADVAEILAGDRRNLGHEVKAGVAALGVAFDDLGVLGDGPVEGLQEGGFVGRRAGLDQPPFQDGRGLDDALDALGVVDPRQLDDDLVAAVALDDGLGHAELVDAVADGLDRLVDGLVAQCLHGHGLHGHRRRGPVEGVVPFAGEEVELLAGFAFLVGVKSLQGQFARALAAGDGAEGDRVFLKGVSQAQGHLVGVHAHGVLGQDLHDQVDAALEVQSQVDLVLNVHEHGDGQDGHGQDDFPA